MSILCKINLIKFNLLTYQIKNKINILMITETKLDESFPIGQFFINGFSSAFVLDRIRNDGGILLNISEDIPSKPLSIEKKIGGCFVEIKFHKKK